MRYGKHISAGLVETQKEILDRKSGKFINLSTGIQKIDDALFGGLEPWRILAIAGLSGSGKSTLLEQLKDNLFESAKVKNIDLHVLDFSFEMLLKDSLLRVISNRTSKSIGEIFSEDVDITKIIAELKSRKHFVVDTVINIDEMEQVIMEFCKSDDIDRFNIVTIDHTLLTKSTTTEVEKQIIDQLFHMLVRVKKKLSAEGNKVSFIVLSQLNRDIESKDRVTNNMLHYPTKNDIFAASSVYYCSDYVWVVHCPANVSGIKTNYGPNLPGFPAGLPIRMLDKDTKTNKKLIYVHGIKNRFGMPNKLFAFLEDFEHARVRSISLVSEVEYNPN